MHRHYLYLVAFISLITVPLSVPAETMTDAVGAIVQQHDQAWDHTTTDAGFSVDLPAVDSNLLVEQVKSLLVLLKQRQQELTEFVDRNKLGTKDAVITAIMPGGLLYAAYKKNKLEQAKTELVRTTEEVAELAHDLLAMQEQTGRLTVAQLQ